jgi:hypothetical protein
MNPSRHKSWTDDSPYDRFYDFIAQNADRYKIILERIRTLKLNSAVIPVAGNRHFFIFPKNQELPRASGGVFPFRNQSPVMLVAHYDRVMGSPGANDNSAAVFHLLKAASILDQRNMNYWMIVFTDKEEIASGESISAQGSFSLAEKLISWGLENVKIFNFDACGTGDTFIFSSTTDHILKNSESPAIRKAKKLTRKLRDYALETAHYMRLNKVLLLPTPFSDDAGFLRAGLPGQTITMLPSREAGRYADLLRLRPEFADALIAGGIKNPVERRNIPETWRLLNSAQDKPSRLTPRFFAQVVRFAVELCR